MYITMMMAVMKFWLLTTVNNKVTRVNSLINKVMRVNSLIDKVTDSNLLINKINKQTAKPTTNL